MRHEARIMVAGLARAREPLAWLACLTNAVPLSVVLVAFLKWLVGPVSSWAAMAIYISVFTSLVWLLKPWSIPAAQSPGRAG